LTKESLTPKLWVDAEICLSDLDAPSLKLLNKMAPYGPQNSRPVFLSKGLQVVGSPRVVGNNHLKFSVRQDNVVMDAIGFELGELLYRISDNASDLDMIYTVEENEWNDRVTVQLRVKDLR
jgi:single-stranded-DNA-specific exonuclease